MKTVAPIFSVAILLLLLAGCHTPKPFAPKEHLVDVRAWPSEGTNYTFPERTGSATGKYRPVTGRTGVCFSGGGTRSLSATAGQLRALVNAGLIEDVAYISCVSGGSWASTVFTYYQEGARNDAQLLGPVIPPENITRVNLDQMDPHSLGHTATTNFRAYILSDLLSLRIPGDQSWVRAVGQTFFKPFGLYDPRNPAWFSLNEATVADIRARNPSLRDAPFHVVRNNSTDARRPYLVINSCIVWPTKNKEIEHLVHFEYTPLYVGSIYHLSLSDDKETRGVGGSYIETHGMGSQAPVETGRIGQSVQVRQPGRPFTLADASGASSAAYASFLDRFDPHLSPWQHTWSSKDGVSGPTRFDAFGDGGNLENYGLISLLRRELTSIVVFINTPTKLDPQYHPGDDPLSNPPASDQVDANLPQLFGVPVLKKGEPTHPHPNNTVFAAPEFARLVKDLQADKAAGRPLVKTMNLKTVKNDWWGIRGGQSVKICWVYLDRVAEWEDRLDQEIVADIDRGNAKNPAGPFKHFPNYKTIGENPLAILRFSTPQVNLLGHLSHWVVENSSEIADTLNNP